MESTSNVVRVLPNILFHPGRFFHEQHAISLRRSILTIGIVLAVGALILFGVSLYNDASQPGRPSIVGQVSGYPKILTAKLHRPWNRLAFPFYWGAFLLLSGLCRRPFIMLMGRTGATADTFALTNYASLPILLCAVVIGLITEFIPKAMTLNQSFLNTQLAVTLGAYVVVFAWEAWIFVTGMMVVHSKSWGKALLCWVGGYTVLFSVGCGIILVPLKLLG